MGMMEANAIIQSVLVLRGQAQPELGASTSGGKFLFPIYWGQRGAQGSDELDE